jgi:peroxiredoxin
MLEVGEKAAPFQVPGIDGELRSLEQLRAESPVLLVFFKVDCPVCQLTWPFLERIHQSAAPGKLRVVGISQNGPRDTASFAAEFGSTFLMLVDPAKSGYQASNAFGVSVVPSLFLVERDGAISWTNSGFCKQELEDLGNRFGVQVFRQEENVPAWRAV